VPLIEEGWLASDITDEVLLHYLRPMLDAGIDTLVLGCTHYPLLRPAIGRLLGGSVALVDAAENCAASVRQLLERENLNAAIGDAGALRVALTDPPDSFLQIANEALQLDVGEVELCTVG